MTEQTINSDDMTLKRLFQDFYRVPDYQREYVWGETDANGQGGEEVDQFLADIYSEFETATPDFAPEYFIGTIVVCKGMDDVFELVDGQQRTTTTYLTLCAIRDALKDLESPLPEELKNQLAASTVDWRGVSVARFRLDLQYEDSDGILSQYGEGLANTVDKERTRSIRNIGNAYSTIREFIRISLKNDPATINRFYGYLTNKVKIIRIETPSITKALKIFETINDRGVGLDAMDLLKNLLFMNARESEFQKLKTIWKQLTDEIYAASEKPLRFLRYFLLATYDVDGRLREEQIYDWFLRNTSLTKHSDKPLGFAQQLLDAAKAYRFFSENKNPSGKKEPSLVNARLLGGRSVKQHYIILLAGRLLPASEFSRLCDEIEKTLFVWLITGTPGKEYERKIVETAHRLSTLGSQNFNDFIEEAFIKERSVYADSFVAVLQSLRTFDTRQFRIRYLISKLTQHIDLLAYGPSQGRDNLEEYVAGGNDIEHILPDHGDEEAVIEFGDGGTNQLIIQRIGNLLLIEKSINRSIRNKKYSIKIKTYSQSKYLLTRCQASSENCRVGVADRITKAVNTIESFPVWNTNTVIERQKYLVRLACEVWDVYPPQSRVPS